MTRKPTLDYSTIVSAFDDAHQALRETEWVTNPADPTSRDRGLVRRGDVIWFNRNHLDYGSVWQQALLGDKTLRYVHHHDFEPVAAD